MRTTSLYLGAAVLLTFAATLFGQPNRHHRFVSVAANADHTISLTLTSSVPSSLLNYYELFPVEASPNLADWTPLATLVRTNNSTNALLFSDSASTNLPLRFYRTPTNELTTPIPRPAGPYAVGTVARLFTDPSRTNRYNIPTNSSFMVQFWYPAATQAGVLPAAYLDRSLATTWYSFYLRVASRGI